MSIYQDHERLCWVSDGQKVVAPWPTKEQPGRGIRCVVVKAMGCHALVVNEQHNFQRTLEVTELFPDDGRIDRIKAERKAQEEAQKAQEEAERLAKQALIRNKKGVGRVQPRGKR